MTRFNPDQQAIKTIGENRTVLLLVLFLTAIAVRLFLFFTISSPIFFYKYPFFADQLNRGVPIGERILDLSPLYLYAMVLIQKMYGSNWEAMTVFQLLTGSLTIVIIFLIGEKLFNRTIGLMAALILILYGNLVLFELTLEPDSLVLFLNSLFVLTLLGIKEKLPFRGIGLAWFSAGVILGLSVITKANALFFVPATLLWIFWVIPEKKRKIQGAVLLLVGVSLTVMPVTLRNFVTFHDPVLVTADLGKVFFHGNGPQANGWERADLPDQGFIEESGQEPDYAHTLFRTAARSLSRQNLSPSECSRFWILQTLDHMASHPGSAIRLLAKKFLLFWHNYEVHDLDLTYAYYRTLRSWPLIPFGFMSALGIVGMVGSRNRFKAVYWAYMMVLGYLLTLVLFFDASRYRLPAVPFLALFSAAGIAELIEAFRGRQFKKGILVSGAAILLFSGSILLFNAEVASLDRWQQATRIYYNLEGNLLFKKGKYQQAVVQYEQAIALAPRFAPAYNQLGKTYALLNDFERAEKNFLQVVHLSPGVDQGYMNLGFLYEIQGQSLLAIRYFSQAYSLNPRNTQVRERLERLRPAIAP